MTYPSVLSERATLDAVLAGASLARYGDGEFNLALGRSIPCQRHTDEIGARLREILHEADCLVGIPNLRSDTPKADFWSKYNSAASLLADRIYGSAFVTRPDSAPWINTPEYWQAVESLWVGRDVTLVRGTSRSLTKFDLLGAREVTEIMAPLTDAFASFDALLEQIGSPSLALLCLGPTATVLAVELAARGVQAIDLGHVGLFLKKHRRGEPMVVTEADKVVAA